jgi:DNA-binding GntR family transcriptional regulator
VYTIDRSELQSNVIVNPSMAREPLVSRHREQGSILRNKNRRTISRAEQQFPVPGSLPKSKAAANRSAQHPDSRSLSDVAYARVVDMLRSRELSPNDVILETRLSRQLNISRTPLREAIRRLEGERILERQKSGTLVVRAISIEDLLHIWQIRILLEGDAARRAAGQISVRDLKTLRASLVNMKNNGNPTPEELRAVGRDLHSLIAQACGNPMLAAIIEDFRKRTQLLTIRRVPERAMKVCEEHLAIVDALLAGDGDDSKTAMQRHIEGVRAYTLEKLGAL